MENLLEGMKLVMLFISEHLIFINFVLAIIIVFFQRKEPKSAWAWLLILYFIPIIGFVFYLLAGTDVHKRKLFKNKDSSVHTFYFSKFGKIYEGMSIDKNNFKKDKNLHSRHPGMWIFIFL